MCGVDYVGMAEDVHNVHVGALYIEIILTVSPLSLYSMKKIWRYKNTSIRV